MLLFDIQTSDSFKNVSGYELIFVFFFKYLQIAKSLLYTSVLEKSNPEQFVVHDFFEKKKLQFRPIQRFNIELKKGFWECAAFKIYYFYVLMTLVFQLIISRKFSVN